MLFLVFGMVLGGFLRRVGVLVEGVVDLSIGCDVLFGVVFGFEGLGIFLKGMFWFCYL